MGLDSKLVSGHAVRPVACTTITGSTMGRQIPHMTPAGQPTSGSDPPPQPGPILTERAGRHLHCQPQGLGVGQPAHDHPGRGRRRHHPGHPASLQARRPGRRVPGPHRLHPGPMSRHPNHKLKYSNRTPPPPRLVACPLVDPACASRPESDHPHGNHHGSREGHGRPPPARRVPPASATQRPVADRPGEVMGLLVG